MGLDSDVAVDVTDGIVDVVTMVSLTLTGDPLSSYACSAAIEEAKARTDIKSVDLNCMVDGREVKNRSWEAGVGN